MRFTCGACQTVWASRFRHLSECFHLSNVNVPVLRRRTRSSRLVDVPLSSMTACQHDSCSAVQVQISEFCVRAFGEGVVASSDIVTFAQASHIHERLGRVLMSG